MYLLPVYNTVHTCTWNNKFLRTTTIHIHIYIYSVIHHIHALYVVKYKYSGYWAGGLTSAPGWLAASHRHWTGLQLWAWLPEEEEKEEEEEEMKERDEVCICTCIIIHIQNYSTHCIYTSQLEGFDKYCTCTCTYTNENQSGWNTRIFAHDTFVLHFFTFCTFQLSLTEYCWWRGISSELARESDMLQHILWWVRRKSRREGGNIKQWYHTLLPFSFFFLTWATSQHSGYETWDHTWWLWGL